MMRNIRLLLRYSLKGQRTKGKFQMPTPVRSLIFAIVILCLSGGVAGAVASAYGILEKLGKQELLLYFILALGSGITFVIGLFSVLNNFFLAEDNEIYISLPFRASEIVISKLIRILIYLYIYSLIIVLPLIAYGTVSNSNPIYYIFVALAYIFNPIIPMIIGFIISTILMSISNLSKHKDVIKVIFSILLIVFIILINLLFQGNRIGIRTANAIVGKESLLKLISSIFINNKLEVMALSNPGSSTGYINMGIVLLIVIILFALLYFVSEKLYLKSLKGFGDISSNKEKIKVAKVKSSSVLKALVIKEIKIIFRNPTFFLNCVVMLFYIPVLYMVILFSNGANHLNWSLGYLIIGGTPLVIGVGMSSGSAGSTALSREGNNFIVSKYIPVSYKTQLLAKIISAFTINSLILIIGIGLLVIEKVRLEIFILSLIIQILTCFLITVIGILCDYISPKIVWQTEKNLYKGNFKSLGNIIISVIFGGILLGFALLTKSILLTFIVNFLLLVISIIIVLFILNKKVVKTYNLL